MSKPRFSIITPTYNRLGFLKHAAASLDDQGYQDWEHIIIDGGSTDGTQEWARSRPRTLLISEPDNGVYDAMNKGLVLSRGNIIGFLNSDDRYEPGALLAVDEAFESAPQAASVSGIAVIITQGGAVERVDGLDELGIEPAPVLLGRCTPNSRFFWRAAALETGKFDLAYSYVADRDWLLRFAIRGHRTVTIAKTLYRYVRHGDSLTFDPQRRHLAAIRRDRLRLGMHWRADLSAPAPIRATAARLEIKMRLAVASDELRALHFIRALSVTCDPRAWLEVKRAW